MSEIASLLAQSRAAHLAKKRHAGTIGKDGSVTAQPSYPDAERHIREALSLREQAHALDPDHADPAWAADLTLYRGVSHEALCASFRGYLQPDPTPAPKSIEEIEAAVNHADPRGSLAYALLLLESGWIQPSDIPSELLKTGAFMRFRERST